MPNDPVRIDGPLIRIDLDWWNLHFQEYHHELDDILYLQSLKQVQLNCPRILWIENTKKARRLLRLGDFSDKD